MALTATATPRVREDIRQSLRIDAGNEFIGSFDRPNLFLEVVPKNRPLDQLLDFLARYSDESGIVYCATRQQTDDLHATLRDKGYSVRPYHAGLSERERTENQDLFSRDHIRIIVATIAFGMGINKPNVRFVVHYDLPRSVDNYYQEIGRAGRDGLPAHCLLLFGYGDLRKVRYFIEQKTEQEQKVANILLNHLMGFAETDLCRRIPLMRYFGETDPPEPCGMCDNCLLGEGDKDIVDLTVPAQMFLSCVKRTGEFFGAGHVIDVLRGSVAQKVLKFGHEKLSTHGIGAAWTAGQWRHISRQLIQKGLLDPDYRHGTLKLTPQAWDVLRGKEIVRGRLEEAGKGKDGRAGRRKAKRGIPDLPPGSVAPSFQAGQGAAVADSCDPVLFEALRKKRKELAEGANLPPFTIFHDRTLREIAVHHPGTRESLATIHGIGAAKLEKYGDLILEIVRQHGRKQGAESPLKPF